MNSDMHYLYGELSFREYPKPEDIDMDNGMHHVYPGQKIIVLDTQTGRFAVDAVYQMITPFLPDMGRDCPGTHEKVHYRLFSRYTDECWLDVLTSGYGNEIHFASVELFRQYLYTLDDYEVVDIVEDAIDRIHSQQIHHYPRVTYDALNKMSRVGAAMNDLPKPEAEKSEFAEIPFNSDDPKVYPVIGDRVYVPFHKVRFSFDQEVNTVAESATWIQEVEVEELEWKYPDIIVSSKGEQYPLVCNPGQGECYFLCAYTTKEASLRSLGRREKWWQFWRAKIEVVAIA